MTAIKERLSSNTLFHFTGSRENLISILTYEFSPRYCLEDLTMLGITEADKTALELAVPMICFCDIPLSKVQFHISCYGNYGIGMSKSWGIKNQFSPILYANKNSETICLIKEMFKATRFGENNLVPSINNMGILLSSFFRFIKPHTGDFAHKGKRHKNRRYYDEREWRYAPTFDKIEHDIRPFLTKIEFLDSEIRNQANEKLRKNFTLSFTPKDIEYIIVKTKSEIPSIINDIMSIKSKYSEDTRRLLLSKIISCENIGSDF